ncbi:recombination protein NinB [Pseudomonas syringae]|uniref:Recombination protein NinB n=1 Tax=Pseudomonas syringae pv. papulans TaxID=83963 RepID=A0A0Q0AIU7_PSESX|nr:recombination protein NinB [Pseudomonas syringae]KPY33186.1 Uncharacterized protein ALO65_03187 [Pseudomonas syringae pv. papulans]KWS33171.1 NinB family protein [Pseudomonas syringae pv. papulans]MDH4604595.1 recombination protein NinB [Pseudomonas syringae pv. papulans]MDH4623798.1 recombination protein NinB [Pseudomonas syringae pv. papulans]RMN47918.1 hypothetical protein ALQ60_02009 [Pseudomonas syringae pv. papulans]
MTEMIMRSLDDTSRLLGILHGTDFTKPKKIVIKDQDRSGEQNRLLHKLLTQVADQVEWHGKKLSVTVWKRLCTAAWLREEGHNAMLVPALDGNGFDMIFEHTSKLTVKQCASLITWVEAFGSQSGVKWAAQDVWGGKY